MSWAACGARATTSAAPLRDRVVRAAARRCCDTPLARAAPAARSILYQRGIYPQETFAQKKHYGLAMMVTKDDGLLAYLTNVTKQMTGARGRARGHAAWRAHARMGASARRSVARRAGVQARVRSGGSAAACRAQGLVAVRGPQATIRLRTPVTPPQPTRTPQTDWLERGLLQRLVLVVTSAYTSEVLERWTFEVQTDAATLGGG